MPAVAEFGARIQAYRAQAETNLSEPVLWLRRPRFRLPRDGVSLHRCVRQRFSRGRNLQPELRRRPSDSSRPQRAASKIDSDPTQFSVELQSQAIWSVSASWVRKLEEFPGGAARRRFITRIGLAIRKGLIADKKLSYPGHTGFSLINDELDAPEARPVKDFVGCLLHSGNPKMLRSPSRPAPALSQPGHGPAPTTEETPALLLGRPSGGLWMQRGRLVSEDHCTPMAPRVCRKPGPQQVGVTCVK